MSENNQTLETESIDGQDDFDVSIDEQVHFDVSTDLPVFKQKLLTTCKEQNHNY